MPSVLHRRQLLAVLVLVALVLGAVPAAACADGDDCGMTVTAETPACGGDSCPLAGALGAVPAPVGSSDSPALACCAGPELDHPAPGLLTTDRSEDRSAAAVSLDVPAVASPRAASPTPHTSRDRPGGSSIALHRLHSIDLC